MSAVAVLILVIAIVGVALVGAVTTLLVRGRKPQPLPDTHSDVLVQPPVEEAEPGQLDEPVELSSPPASTQALEP